MKKIDIIHSSLWVLLALVLLPTGCNDNRPKDLPKLNKVTLHFTQDGSPCAGASVSLVPLDSSPWIVGGTTDASGAVQLKTHGEFVGVPAGKYRIAINKTEKDAPKENAGGGGMASMMTPVVDSYHLIDTQFASRSKSPLEIEVVDGKNTFEPFELGPPIRVRMKQPGEK